MMLDCGDSGCYFAKNKGGMRTNGGCRCFESAGFSKGMHAAAREMLLEVLKLRSECNSLHVTVDVLKRCMKAISPAALALVEVELVSLGGLQNFVKSAV